MIKIESTFAIFICLFSFPLSLSCCGGGSNNDNAVSNTGVARTTITASVPNDIITLLDEEVQTTLSCTPSSSPTLLEAKCDADESWITITSSLSCTYTATGTYTPSCRLNGSLTDELSLIVGIPVTGVQAGISPTSGSTANAYTLSCDTQGGPAWKLEGKCHTSDEWQIIVSGNRLFCWYTSPGNYIPSCRANESFEDSVNSAITVISNYSTLRLTCNGQNQFTYNIYQGDCNPIFEVLAGTAVVGTISSPSFCANGGSSQSFQVHAGSQRIRVVEKVTAFFEEIGGKSTASKTVYDQNLSLLAGQVHSVSFKSNCDLTD